MATRTLTVREELWPIAGGFRIARGAKTEARVVVAEIHEAGARGRGEAVPYSRYGETPEGVLAAVERLRAAIEAGASREDLQGLIEPGAARNAMDCALWDLEAKLSDEPAWRRAGAGAPEPVTTCYTISLDEPQTMAAAARAAAARPVLKIKVGADGVLQRVAAVRSAAPEARLVVDANEALTFEAFRALAPGLAELGVSLVEQPLPAGADAALEGFDSPVPLCADESLHTRRELAECARRYGCVNIKLDKAGGLTEALALAAEARAMGLEIMVGCMVATSLAMAPALILAQGAAFVDLDGPLLLARDREPGLVFHGSTIMPADATLWG